MPAHGWVPCLRGMTGFGVCAEAKISPTLSSPRRRGPIRDVAWSQRMERFILVTVQKYT
ncbi:hypothetical protein Lgee_0806 [Legionella geestiana]|uniref:Uncharacterized protein n=1 Tax=Legionella geestiana TaxID=45065 RepID=A0A0W0U2M0_9GAMM|nr:hypothetical protein Lgee_0806 [Legionella geestiana]STX53228.1 Uncharacterised protein [Legionella geestiana]